MAAILKEIRILESGLYGPQGHMPRSTVSTFHMASPDHPTKKLGNSDNKRRQQCVFCKGAHSPHNCDVVTILSESGLTLSNEVTCVLTV